LKGTDWTGRKENEILFLFCCIKLLIQGQFYNFSGSSTKGRACLNDFQLPSFPKIYLWKLGKGVLENKE
jgi:hypothetical protein